MGDKLPSSGLVVLLGTLALLVAGGAGNPVPSDTEDAAQKRKPKQEQLQPTPEATTLTSIQRLIAHSFMQRGKEADKLEPAKIEALFRCEGEKPCPNRVTVATIADPLDSKLSHIFDEQITAFLNAASSRGFSLRSYTLPWSRSTPAKSPPDIGAAEAIVGKICWVENTGTSGANERTVCRKERIAPGHRSSPGALLFVKPRDQTGPASREQLLLVLLVGETPTTGVHPKALRAAFDSWYELDPVPDDSSLRRMSVIGPTFSGSADALREHARAFSEHPRDDYVTAVDLYSGSATSDALDPGTCDQHPQPSICVFQITHTDSELLQGLGRYLDTAGFTAKRVALISEGATAYGQAAKGMGERTVLATRFPFHVSQLRALSERSGSRRGEDALATPIARQALDLTADDAGLPIDVPSPYAPTTSAAVVDLEIADLLADLRERRVSLAVLLATDVRDKVFLAEHVRRNAPEIQLASLESDLFLTHPRFTRSLLGMLVVSSYAGSARARFDRRSDTSSTLELPLQAIGSSGAEGIEAAAALAFDRVRDERTCREGLPPVGSTWRACGFFAQQPPPVFISVVGRDGLWLVALEAKDAILLGRPGSASLAYLMFLNLLAIGAIHHAFRYAAAIFGSSATTRSMSLRWLLRRPDEGESYGLRAIRPIYLGLIGGGLMFLTAMPLMLAMGARSERTAFWWLPVAIPLAALVGSVTPVLLDALLHTPRCRPPLGPLPTSLLSVASAAVLGHGYALALWWAATGSDSANWILYAHRTAHLNGGVSSALPFVFLGLGIAFCAVSLAHRASLDQGLRAKSPFPASVGADASGTFKQLDAIWRSLKDLTTPFSPEPVSGRTNLAICASLALLPALVFWTHLNLPIDGFWSRVAFGALTAVLLTAIVISGVRLFRIWLATRRFLRLVSATPLAHAFGRLPGRLGRTVGFELQARLLSLSDLEYCLQQARLLASDGGIPGLRTNAASHLAQIQVAQLADRDLEQSNRWSLPASSTETQKLLNELSRKVLTVLSQEWRKLGRRVGGDDTDVSEALRSVDEKPANVPSDAVTLLETHSLRGSPELFMRLAEEFVAAQIVSFVSYLFGHLRPLIFSCSFGLVLLLLGVTSYPFEPQAAATNFVVVLFAIAIVASIVAFAQASRNEILSMIENTTPNAVTWNGAFVMQLAAYVGVPALAALSSQLPALGRLVAMLFDAIT